MLARSAAATWSAIVRLDWLGRIIHDEQGAYFEINLT